VNIGFPLGEPKVETKFNLADKKLQEYIYNTQVNCTINPQYRVVYDDEFLEDGSVQRKIKWCNGYGDKWKL